MAWAILPEPIIPIFTGHLQKKQRILLRKTKRFRKPQITEADHQYSRRLPEGSVRLIGNMHR